MNETLRANEEVRVRKETEGFSTTFFMDFSIADRFGDDAIKEHSTNGKGTTVTLQIL